MLLLQFISRKVMNRWIGKVALVTGASAGIGASVTEKLAKSGVRVFALARRVEKIEEMKENVGKVKGEIIPIKGDVAKENDISEVFKTIKETFGNIHILVNNAGIARRGFINELDVKLFKETFDVNVLGLANCTQQALKLMNETNVDDGHIIFINSIVGHYVPRMPIPSNVYPASKHAVRALAESLRQELVFLNSKIRISNISPGIVETEFRKAALEGAGIKVKEGENLFDGWPALQAKDLADAVLYVLSTPPHVQVQELTIRPIGEYI